MLNRTKKRALLATVALPGLLFAGATVAGADDAPDDTNTSTSDGTSTGETATDDTAKGERKGDGCGHGVHALVDALGMEPDEVREALEGGATIADLATQQGVDIDAAIDQIVADAEAKVAE
ncbi:MAG: hypothetical protein GY925_07785, partial [Actinomycetia bacterium]|nr:hypothetical protein [Actinomycetes bacterium]